MAQATQGDQHEVGLRGMVVNPVENVAWTDVHFADGASVNDSWRYSRCVADGFVSR